MTKVRQLPHFTSCLLERILPLRPLEPERPAFLEPYLLFLGPRRGGGEQGVGQAGPCWITGGEFSLRRGKPNTNTGEGALAPPTPLAPRPGLTPGLTFTGWLGGDADRAIGQTAGLLFSVPITRLSVGLRARRAVGLFWWTTAKLLRAEGSALIQHTRKSGP